MSTFSGFSGLRGCASLQPNQVVHICDVGIPAPGLELDWLTALYQLVSKYVPRRSAGKANYGMTKYFSTLTLVSATRGDEVVGGYRKKGCCCRAVDIVNR